MDGPLGTEPGLVTEHKIEIFAIALGNDLRSAPFLFGADPSPCTSRGNPVRLQLRPIFRNSRALRRYQILCHVAQRTSDAARLREPALIAPPMSNKRLVAHLVGRAARITFVMPHENVAVCEKDSERAVKTGFVERPAFRT